MQPTRRAERARGLAARQDGAAHAGGALQGSAAAAVCVCWDVQHAVPVCLATNLDGEQALCSRAAAATAAAATHVAVGRRGESLARARVSVCCVGQVDGIHVSAGGGDGEGGEGPPRRVMVLAATNFPWDIDEAMR